MYPSYSGVHTLLLYKLHVTMSVCKPHYSLVLRSYSTLGLLVLLCRKSSCFPALSALSAVSSFPFLFFFYGIRSICRQTYSRVTYDYSSHGEKAERDESEEDDRQRGCDHTDQRTSHHFASTSQQEIRTRRTE